MAVADFRHRVGDIGWRDAEDARVAKILNVLDEMVEVDFDGYTRKWKDIVWKRTVLLRMMQQELRADWG